MFTEKKRGKSSPGTEYSDMCHIGTIDSCESFHDKIEDNILPELEQLLQKYLSFFLCNDEQDQEDIFANDAEANTDVDEDILFDIVEVAVFRSTDGLRFNLLKIPTKAKVKVTPGTQIIKLKLKVYRESCYCAHKNNLNCLTVTISL